MIRAIIWMFTIIGINVLIGYLKYTTLGNDSQGTNQVRLPKAYFWIGIVGTIIFVGFIIFTFFAVKNKTLADFWIPVVGFSLFVLLGLTIVLGYLNSRVDIGEYEFTYQTFLRRRYRYKYTDIKRIRNTDHTLHLYMEKKHLYIDWHASGSDEFYDMICKRRR